ncbi:hypothetical protein SAMN04515671_1467 [Nakamurella panacisegetis]|uniref:Uncharacterized protein n=1 Tax=Nakamurella panacisegetis TaxID=1090615 RepID=A0A1H0KXN6_9ACTN|nr:hypothetical protein [Nakamurella panacisegetis]SDO60615.1 hypothetical protein SAMN04515671_1467 [Nakamurella panacisegetis]
MHPIVTLEALTAGSDAVDQMVWFGGGLLVLGLTAMILSGRNHAARKRLKEPERNSPG